MLGLPSHTFSIDYCFWCELFEKGFDEHKKLKVFAATIPFQSRKGQFN
jgi:hypothetical protein